MHPPLPSERWPQNSQELPSYNPYIDSGQNLRSRIEPKIEKILRKIHNGFPRNRSPPSQILTTLRILEGVPAENLEATILFIDFSKAFESIHRGKMGQIILSHGLPKETVASIMMLHKHTKVKARMEALISSTCSRWAARIHISPIPVYHLPRLRA